MPFGRLREHLRQAQGTPSAGSGNAFGRLREHLRQAQGAARSRSRVAASCPSRDIGRARRRHSRTQRRASGGVVPIPRGRMGTTAPLSNTAPLAHASGRATLRRMPFDKLREHLRQAQGTPSTSSGNTSTSSGSGPGSVSEPPPHERSPAQGMSFSPRANFSTNEAIFRARAASVFRAWMR
jgi:hypothetical protein